MIGIYSTFMMMVVWSTIELNQNDTALSCRIGFRIDIGSFEKIGEFKIEMDTGNMEHRVSRL